MNSLAKATLQASIGALIGNRSIKYALGGGVMPVNKVDCFAVGMGAVTPVMLSHIFKKSLVSVTGFHGITGCVIAGILTYLLHEKKGNNTMRNDYTPIQRHNQNQPTDRTCGLNKLTKKMIRHIKKFPINSDKNMTIQDIPTYCLDNKKYKGLEKHRKQQKAVNQDIIEYKAKKQEKEKLKKAQNKQHISGMLYPVLNKHKEIQKHTKKSYADFGEKIDESVKSIQDKILTLLTKCSPENIHSLQKQVAEKLSPVKEEYGTALKRAYEKKVRDSHNQINQIHTKIQELHESIEEYAHIQHCNRALWYKGNREESRNASHKMTEAMNNIREYSSELLSEQDNPENPLQNIIKTIMPMITHHAEQHYTETLAKNVDFIVKDVAEDFASGEQWDKLQTIIQTFSLSDLEKFRDFAYNTSDLIDNLGRKDCKSHEYEVSPDEEEKNTRNMLSDTMIESRNESKTPLEQAEKILLYITRDRKFNDIEWSRNRIAKRAKAQATGRQQVEPITMYAANKHLDELKKVYAKVDNTNQTDTKQDADELKFPPLPDNDPKIKAFEERLNRLNQKMI